MNFEPTLSSRFAAYVRDYLLDRDIDPGPIFDACGIACKGEDCDTPIPVPKVAALLDLAAQASGNPCMGMDMGQRYHYESASILIMAMLAAPRVDVGIKCLNRYDKHVDSGIETTFDFDQSLAEFSASVMANDEVKLDQLNEYLMVFLVRTLFIATRVKVPLQEVWLCHPVNENAAALEAFFDAPVRFGQQANKLFVTRDYLQVPFFTANGLLFEVLTSALKTYFLPTADQSGFVDQVSREIIRCTGGDSPSTELIAQRLAISPRTLRRRLSEEGHSFQAAKNLAREKRAKHFLSHTNLPLSEIAFELGFSELSAFSRAFRSWAGMTPQTYRENSRQLFRA